MSVPAHLDALRAALAAHAPDTRPSETSARQAAVAMVLRDRPGGLEALFIRRAEHPEDPWSGHMALPGGRRDPEDAELAHAAVRETAEEVGLSLVDAEYLGRLDDIKAGRLEIFDLSVTPFVFHHPEPGDLVPNYEVAEAVWLPLAHFLDPANVSAYPLQWNGAEQAFPAFVVGPYTIWGLTYRVLQCLARLLAVRLPDHAPTGVSP
jgi:8-oxo-dGTP pyrophosphatase MutT (NUDIX family)